MIDLSEQQRKRVLEISQYHSTDTWNTLSILNAIYQALEEIVPQKVEESLKLLRHDYSE